MDQNPKAMNLHFLTTAMMLASAASPLVSSPQQKEAALNVIKNMTREMLEGVEDYRKAKKADDKKQHKPVWQSGSSCLLQIISDAKASAIPVLIVPSLINRHDILDLDAEHSFAQYLAGQGVDPYILEWGAPQTDEYSFSVDTYITQRLLPALEFLNAQKGNVHVLGYCMGGTMALGAVATLPDDAAKHVRSLTLLAAPWDFHAGDQTLKLRMQAVMNAAEPVMEATQVLPVDWIQALFASVDPLFAFNKFRAFAAMDKNSPEAKRFVMVENWLNDGVDLAAPAAKQALAEWYIENQPYNGVWTLNKNLVDITKIKQPVLVVAAGKDKLVPKESALAVTAQIENCTAMQPDIGHIGMMASPRARVMVWQPVVEWLQTH
jgi:polyhydroxyalkanoate synthase